MEEINTQEKILVIVEGFSDGRIKARESKNDIMVESLVSRHMETQLRRKKYKFDLENLYLFEYTLDTKEFELVGVFDLINTMEIDAQVDYYNEFRKK